MGLKYSQFAIRGIDISQFNGVIDWSKVQGNFVAIRVGYGNTIDSKFVENAANAHKKGINLVFYWYMDYYNNHISGSSVNGMSDAAWGKLQAENCWNAIKDYQHVSVFIDVESTNGNYAPKIETVQARAQAIMGAFLSRMDELNNKENGIYCSLGLLPWFYAKYRSRPLWVAWYVYRTSLVGTMAIVQMCIDKGWNTKPLIWQYARDGDIDDNGIPDGREMGTQYDFLDLNGWVGTQAQYAEMFGSVTIPVEPPVIIPEPIDTVTTMSVMRTVSLRKAPITTASTFIALLPAGTKLDIVDKKVEGNNTWRKVALWVAEKYNEITYLK